MNERDHRIHGGALRLRPYALLAANARIQDAPDDMTRVGKVIAHETTDEGLVFPVVLYEDGQREKLQQWRRPLPSLGSLVRVGSVSSSEVF